jgi:glycosyltransferase involved in cell wall biosynthesis
MLALARRLPRDRFDVEFVLTSGPGVYGRLVPDAGARWVALGPEPSGRKMLPVRFWERLRKLVRYVATARRHRYDVIDAWLFPADITAALTRFATGVPVVIAGRVNLGDFGDARDPIKRRLGRLANQFTDAIVANSELVAEDVRKNEWLRQGQLRIIYGGVEPAPPVTAEERRVGRASLGVADREFLVGCVATYRPAKRLDLLIDAFAALARDVPEARLVLVGDGELRLTLEKQVARLGLGARVRLHGWEPDPRPLYPLFDAVAQASYTEGLPNFLLEAGSAARAIVATDVGGTREIVRHDETGLLVAAGDVDGMTEALRRLAGDPALRTRLGERAREHIAARFGIDRFVAEFAALYEELAAAKGLLPRGPKGHASPSG